MLNFAGQDIQKGDYIGQVARTNQGMKRRIGVVMGEVEVTKMQGRPPEPGFRVIWAEFDEGEWTLLDGTVLPDNVFSIDPHRIDRTLFLSLDAAKWRGHA